MIKYIVIIISIIALTGCKVSTNEIVSLQIGEAKQVVKKHYNTEIEVCLEKPMSNGGVIFFKFENRQNESFNFDYTIHNLKKYTSKRCFNFGTRAHFQSRWTTDGDLKRIQSISKGNLKSVNVRLREKSRDAKILHDTTFINI